MSRYAAIDIGSNSIRMLAAEVNSHATPGQPMQVLAADRQVVRLGKTVFREGKLAASEIELACQVLVRMVEQYRKLDMMGIRAVGTAALRDASNRDEFLARAAAMLPSEVGAIRRQDDPVTRPLAHDVGRQHHRAVSARRVAAGSRAAARGCESAARRRVRRSGLWAATDAGTRRHLQHGVCRVLLDRRRFHPLGA